MLLFIKIIKLKLVILYSIVWEGMILNTSNLVLDPRRILQSFNDDQFEQMICDWQSFYKNTKYSRVELLGASGDKGRDVKCTGLNGELYIFQCKNYQKKLGPHIVFPEIGKCFYHVLKGDYTFPVEYRLVSPLGVTSAMTDLFDNPIKLKLQLKAKWSSLCEKKICSQKVPLDAGLETLIDKTNFSVFNYVSPEEFLEDFKKTCYFSKYFLIINKPRPLGPYSAPKHIRESELVYITKLLAAYSDYLDNNIEDETCLRETNPVLYEDFKRHRFYFYSAESLAQYSREIYPPEDQWFEQVKEEFYHGIIDEIHEDAKHGFEKLKKVIMRAAVLNISLAQKSRGLIRVQDRKGICHHLANERDDVTWKK